jgi:hypothetical protein
VTAFAARAFGRAFPGNPSTIFPNFGRFTSSGLGFI